MAKMLALAKDVFGPITPLVAIDATAYANLVIGAFPAFLGFALNIFASIAATMYANAVEDRETAKLRGITVKEAIRSKTTQRRWILDDEGWGVRLLFFSVPFLAVAAVTVHIYEYVITGLMTETLTLTQGGIVEDLSLVSLIQKVGDGTPVLTLFMVVFGILMVGVPLVRALALSWLALFKVKPMTQYKLAKFCNEIGALLGWEPLILSVVLMQMQLDSITGTIVSKEQCNNYKELQIVQILIAIVEPMELDVCFLITFEHTIGLIVLVVALLLMARLNMMVWNKTLRDLEPFGGEVQAQGPECCCECCPRACNPFGCCCTCCKCPSDYEKSK
jgi:hypothetical protein